MTFRVKSARKPVKFIPRFVPMATAQNFKSIVEKDSLITQTSEDQDEVEKACASMYNWIRSNYDSAPSLAFEKHILYLRNMLEPLPARFVSLDASKPWMIYWTVNALALLGNDISDLGKSIQDTIMMYQNPYGGFGGGTGQLSHLAPTYAAVNVLALCQDPTAWEKINRQKCYEWLISMKQRNGSFTMCQGGESDTRATYCALAVASLLNIMTPQLVENCGEFFRSCQTYEGGFANDPYAEAHAGYTFCSVAGLCLLGSPKQMLTKYSNMERLIQWLISRQMIVEGGFSGRTNKLVDGCYSHWAGGCWPFIEAALELDSDSKSLWNRSALQDYVIVCCQDVNGGLRDKPGTNPDTYHSNYVLSGLSGAQHRYYYNDKDVNTIVLGDYGFHWSSELSTELDIGLNSVRPINPVHVLPEGVAEKMVQFYKSV